MKRTLKYINRIYLVLILVTQYSLSSTAFSQNKIEKEKKEIMGEGLALYTLILANWTSNDLYYENEFNLNNIIGYLSYKDRDTVKTIFWREIDTTSAEYKARTFKAVDDTGAVARKNSGKTSELRVITKTFHYAKMMVTKKNAVIAEEERNPTEYEKMLMNFRQMAYNEMSRDTTFFKEYQGTSLRAVPLDIGKQVKVYIYSASTSDDFVPLGGDYLIRYAKKEKELLDRQMFHNKIIMISSQYRGKSSDATKSTYHNHKAGSPELITATDIATLLLYKKTIEWDEHRVISDKYTCIFTLVDRKLQVISTKEFDYLNKKKAARDKEERNSNFH